LPAKSSPSSPTSYRTATRPIGLGFSNLSKKHGNGAFNGLGIIGLNKRGTVWPAHPLPLSLDEEEEEQEVVSDMLYIRG
jgi:hypothetical protein